MVGLFVCVKIKFVLLTCATCRIYLVCSYSFQKLWEVEDILKRKGSGDDEEVLVKWANWQGPPTWVALSYNTELKAFLTKNRGNPYSSTLVRTELGNPTAETETDLYALRQAIFDVLSEVRYTPEGSVGRQTRVSVKVPFRREEFQDTFGKIMNNKTGATGNNECFLTLEDMNVVFGDDRWSRRQYTTSTETFISSKEFIHISWGYKERLNYNHTQCKR